MESLSARDLRALIEQVDDLQRARSVDDLADATLAGISELIDCDVVGWNVFDSVGRFETRGYPPGYLSDGQLEALDHVDRYNPILSRVLHEPRYCVRAMSDFFSERAFQRSPLYGDYFRNVGVQDQLSAFVCIGEPKVSLALNRSRRGFSRRDRALLELLSTRAVRAYAGLRERDWLRRRVAALSGEGAGELRLEHAAALGLTPRHAEVLALAAEGLTTREIAERLVVSVRTVDKHFENIFERLGVRSRRAAIDRLLRAVAPL